MANPKCTCENAGRCGYCPSIAITATRQASVRTSGAGTRADNTAYGRAADAAADRIERRRR